MSKKLNAFGTLLKQSHMSISKAAKFFNVDPTTARRWRNDKATTPEAVLLCLQSISSGTPVDADKFVLEDKLVDALRSIIRAMKRDPSYAYTWHINLVNAMLDSGVSSQLANEAAARFMYDMFTIDTITGTGGEGHEKDNKDG
jgi:hypothetical protein